VATISSEEFREPDLDLVATTNWGALDAPDPTELRAAQALLRERERRIQGLSARVESLESTMAALLETLHAREAELAALQELLLPAPAVERSHSRLRAIEAPSAATKAAHPTATNEPKPEPEAEANSPHVVRASLELAAATISEKCATAAPLAERSHSARVDCLEFCEYLQLFAGIALDEALGVFVPTYRTAPLGSEVELELELSNGQVVRSRGVIAWVREERDEAALDTERPGLGVKFSNPSSGARAAFQGLCRARPPLYVEL
jgi:hypothetical protein